MFTYHMCVHDRMILITERFRFYLPFAGYFLTQEERSRQEILAKYNLTAPLNLTESYLMTSGHNDGMTRYSVDKSLYGRMTLFRYVLFFMSICLNYLQLLIILY